MHFSVLFTHIVTISGALDSLPMDSKRHLGHFPQPKALPSVFLESKLAAKNSLTHV